MEEIWKDIVIEKNGIIYDYTGFYQVSNMGNVRSLDRIDAGGRRLKGRMIERKPGKSGYVYVGLHKNGEGNEKFRVHRLVATAFIPNPENMPYVNHKDECKSNNCVDNLEWCDAKYNVNYGTSRERASEKISEVIKGDKNPNAKKVICLETKQVFNCIKDAQGWCHGNVSMCCRGRSKTAGGYHWQYLDEYLRELRKQSDINNSRQLAA